MICQVLDKLNEHWPGFIEQFFSRENNFSAHCNELIEKSRANRGDLVPDSSKTECVDNKVYNTALVVSFGQYLYKLSDNLSNDF